MAPRLYPLAPSVWGAAEEVPVERVVQPALFSRFPALRGTAFVGVLLEPNPLNGTWRVRWLGTGAVAPDQGPVIGQVAARHRERFADITRVDASLYRPTTTAAVAFDQAAGHFRVDVLLPPPPLAVPRNDTPPSAVVLPPGDMVVVDTAKGEFTAQELEAHSPGQFFVALHRIGDAVAVTLGDKVLGGFGEADAAELAAFLDAADHPEVYARAVLLAGMAGLNVAGPEEGISRIPALALPDTRPLTPWSITEFPDGTWAVTVQRDHVADPEDAVRPKHTARYVSLAGVERPDDVAAPTQVFQRLDLPEPERKTPAVPITPQATEQAPRQAWSEAGGYLSEVEKVRLRRQARVRSRGGRHRK